MGSLQIPTTTHLSFARYARNPSLEVSRLASKVVAILTVPGAWPGTLLQSFKITLRELIALFLVVTGRVA